MLADPATILLDQPVNGLDPEGVLWIRNLPKSLAAEDRTVFVSSHLMSEMALTADHLIIVGRPADPRQLGHRLHRGGLQPVGAGATPEATRLADLLVGHGVAVSSPEPDQLTVTGLSSEQIGSAAVRAGLDADQAPLELTVDG